MLAVNSKLSWYVTRSSGLLAWALVTVAILWGLALSSRMIRRRGVPAWILSLHKYLGLLALVFTGVHLAALAADNFVHYGWADLFVPMATTRQPGAAAWGIVAFYLLVAIQISSWLMRRMPRRVWHSIHLVSFPLFVTGTIHGLTAGTDRSNALVQWGVLVGVILVVTLLTFRVLTIRERTSPAGPGGRRRGEQVEPLGSGHSGSGYGLRPEPGLVDARGAVRQS